MKNSKRTCTIWDHLTAGKKCYWIMAIILILFFFGYWVKSQLKINLSKSISASSHFPFNYLYNDVLKVNEPGTVIFEDFEQTRIFKKWSDSHFRGDPRVVHKIIQGGPGIESRCLQISSHRNHSWVYKFSKYISVAKGDLFQIKGRVYVTSDSADAIFSIAGFDAAKKPVNWRMARHRVAYKGRWGDVEKQFSITDEKIRYISFRLMGHQGVYRFDDLLLNKVDGPEKID